MEYCSVDVRYTRPAPRLSHSQELEAGGRKCNKRLITAGTEGRMLEPSRCPEDLYGVWRIRLAKNSRSTVAELRLLAYEYDCTPAYN